MKQIVAKYDEIPTDLFMKIRTPQQNFQPKEFPFYRADGSIEIWNVKNNWNQERVGL